MRLEESQVGNPALPLIPGVDSSLVDSLALSRLPHPKCGVWLPRRKFQKALAHLVMAMS